LNGKALHRAFRIVLSIKVRRHLRPSRQDQAAYERYFASVRNSLALRLLYSRMSFPFPVTLEEHALAVSSQIFAKRGIGQFYLPVEWSGQPLTGEIHLAEPSIFLSRHNRFAPGSVAIMELGGEVVTIAANPATQSDRFNRSGLKHPGRLTVLKRDAMALLNLRKELSAGKHASCFVDTHDPATGTSHIEDGLFHFAGKCGRPVYFLRFTVNGRGRIEGSVDGPVDCSDVAVAIGRFRAFTGATLEACRRPHRAG
jgi:hypothetical protein